ncbi:TonB-dependent receptor [Catenovulum maritimum]|uniref:TonB-dependent receptor n=1 Tax=Catenovulum maritimum TaxID=1513271 RepID=A0A0J8GTF7_9ALTE|nr:TonB-dependent receptor [Catenovulum maritimum]KMT66017.1 TonB-dependent receptor [Catenovulum maritimum]
MKGKKINLKPSVIALASSLTMFVQAQATAATLQGEIKAPAANQLITGANVKIKELGLTTVSKRDGSFRFDNLKAGTYTLEINYIGAKPYTSQVEVSEEGVIHQEVMLEAEQEIENLIVRGQRAGQAGAINGQKNSKSIKSIVSADSIGQFPDQNASEALQRLPGMSIERDQGEGRFVGIRGIDPNLNNVTINGLNLPSPEGGVRSVALDVIPSQLIGSLEVSKSVTPDMDGDAIGGSIEVKSLSGFDRAEQSISFNAQVSQNQLRDELSPKLGLSFTDVYQVGADELAIATAVSWSKRKFGSDNVESNGDDEVEHRHYNITRERLGAAVNLDYRADFNNQYFLRSLYSEFSDEEFRLANTFVFDDETEIESGTKSRKETQTILSMTAGAEHIVDSWKIDWQLGYSKSTEDNPNALYYTLVAEELDISTDMQGPIPKVNQSEAVQDLSNYELDEISNESDHSQDKETSLKLDLTKSLEFDSVQAQLKFGAKYRQREKQTYAHINIYDDGFDNIDFVSAKNPHLEWSLGQFGPALDKAYLENLYRTHSTNLELNQLNSRVESEGSSFDISEDIFAAYIMTEINLDKLTLVAGVRYEKTDFATTGARVELIEDEENDNEEVVNTPWISDRSYAKWLPSINARYELTTKLIARAAYSQTLARPNFGDVAAVQVIESKTEFDDDSNTFETEREAEVGNPELKPYFSDNFDLSLEYYPGHIGVMSIGYFHKKISNFVIIANVANTPEWDGYDDVYQPINGEQATLNGVELSWVKSFDNGLIMSANATLTDSEAVTLLDEERFVTSLPNQSDTTANLMIGYETDDISLRLTSVYKSGNQEEIDGDMIRFEDSHTQYDFTAKYFINQRTHVYFNAINLNDEPMYHYFDSKINNAQYEVYGRTFELGFSWNSF